MSVQDPFVLDHNTTSNVTERFRCDIIREFQRASTQCHKLSACSDSFSSEHAWIVGLLSDSASSVSSALSSPQVALGPQQMPDENTVIAEELAHMQLFVLRLQESANFATAVVPPHPRKTEAELEHSVEEPEYRTDDDIGTVSWHRKVTDVVKLMLSDIFDVECVSRNQPNAQFDLQLNQLLKVKCHNSSLVQSRQQGSGMVLHSQPHYARSLDDCVPKDGQLHPCRKHLLSVDDYGNEEDAEDGSSLGGTPAKRHRPDDNVSDVDVISSSASSSQPVHLAKQHVLLSTECSARSRLWVGRKKVRRQFMHFSDELKRQMEVSAALRNELSVSDHAIIEFELEMIGHQQQGANEMIVAVLPSKKTSKEFGCFIMFFISLLQKLVNTVTIEGPLVL